MDSERRYQLSAEAAYPYMGSDLAERVGETRQLFVADIDGTLTTGQREPSSQELADRAEARKWMFENGGVAFISARMPVHMISSMLLAASRLYGFSEPDLHWGIDDAGLRVFRPIEEFRYFDDCVDAHAICPCGSTILLRRNSSYYVPDIQYALPLFGWRNRMLAFIQRNDSDGMVRRAYADIEDPLNYEHGKTDVYPPEYRIMLVWNGRGAMGQKEAIKKCICGWSGKADLFRIAEEHDPRRERFVIYLLPRQALKERMLDRIVQKIAEQVFIRYGDLQIFMAGDNLTDLKAGMYGGKNARLTFLLVSGSPLSCHLSPYGSKAGTPFAGESMQFFTSRLRPTERRGWYVFKPPLRPARTVVIGDEAFGVDAVGPASIAAYLRAA